MIGYLARTAHGTGRVWAGAAWDGDQGRGAVTGGLGDRSGQVRSTARMARMLGIMVINSGPVGEGKVRGSRAVVRLCPAGVKMWLMIDLAEVLDIGVF